MGVTCRSCRGSPSAAGRAEPGSPWSILDTWSWTHLSPPARFFTAGRFWRESKGGEAVRKDRPGVARRLCEVRAQSMAHWHGPPHSQTDRPREARMRLTIRPNGCEVFPSLPPTAHQRSTGVLCPHPAPAAFLRLSEHFFVAQTLQKWCSERESVDFQLWTVIPIPGDGVTVTQGHPCCLTFPDPYSSPRCHGFALWKQLFGRPPAPPPRDSPPCVTPPLERTLSLMTCCF